MLNHAIFFRKKIFFVSYFMSFIIYQILIIGLLIKIDFFTNLFLSGKIIITAIFLTMLLLSYQSLKNCVKTIEIRGNRIFLKFIFGEVKELKEIEDIHFSRANRFILFFLIKDRLLTWRSSLIIKDKNGKQIITRIFSFQNSKLLLKEFEHISKIKIENI